MPGRDGGGPLGAGPLTGRGLGPCAGNRLKYAAGAGAGIGLGLGLGLGLGRRRRFRAASSTPADVSGKSRKQLLLEQKDQLTRRLDAIERQMKDL